MAAAWPRDDLSAITPKIRVVVAAHGPAHVLPGGLHEDVVLAGVVMTTGSFQVEELVVMTVHALPLIQDTPRPAAIVVHTHVGCRTVGKGMGA